MVFSCYKVYTTPVVSHLVLEGGNNYTYGYGEVTVDTRTM